MEERLRERRPARARSGAERGRLGGHGPPVDHAEAELADHACGDPAAGSGAGSRARWREEQLDDGRPFLGPGRVEPERPEHARAERQRDARAVRRGAVGAERTPVRQRRQPAEREREDLRPAGSARVRDEPDAARIVLERGVVQRRDVGVGATARSALWRVDDHPVAGSRFGRWMEDRPPGRSQAIGRMWWGGPTVASGAGVPPARTDGYAW